MDASRNFLYGVVALQANLISSAHFDEFMKVCASQNPDEHVSLADLFVQRGWIQPRDKAHLESLVEMKLQRHAGNPAETLTEITTEMERSLNALRNSAARQSMEAATEARTPSGERYTRTQLHATGGIGRVWLARDTQLQRDVALKELLPGQSGNAIFRARFLREARITGQLEHPGIIPVYELSQHSDTQEAFYVMRFVKGRTMKEAAQTYHQKRHAGQSESLEFLSLLNAFVIVCKTAAYAHSRGIIHRDLKGQNVILGDFGEVVILDWGLAKELRHPGSDVSAPSAIPRAKLQDVELTLEGDAVGTPAYMAPEQAAGRLDLIDERTDVYGLGAMLYQILTGQAPFSGTTTDEVLKKARTEPPVPPETHWPDVPPTLQAACLRALAKAPEQRFGSASELAQEVEKWQEVQRKKVEEDLRVSQALYHSLVENIPIWAWRKDLDSRFTFVNSTFAQGVGLKPEDLVGKTDHDLHFSVALADRIRRDDLHVINSGEILRLTEERTPDEKGPRFVEVIKAPIRDASGQVVGTQGVLWDMSAWKRAEEALQESESLYHSLVESIPICVWRKDVDGRFTFANKGFLANFGKTPEELLGKNDHELFPKELADKYRRDDAHVMKTGETFRVLEEQTALDRRRVVEVIKIPMRDAHGNIIGTQGIFWDTTPWERAQEARGTPGNSD